MADERDLYQVLGVPRSAGKDEIRRAHRQLVRVLHPDRHAQATAAEQQLAERRMREINEAWHTLRDPARRTSYDLTLRSKPTAGGANGSRPSGASPGGRSSARAGGAGRSSAGAPRSGGTRSGSPKSGSAAGSRRGPTSAPGRGAYWSTGSPGHRPPPGRDPGGSDPQGGDSGGAATFLLRRGPVVVIAAVLLGLFVVTAFISGRNTGETTAVIPEPLGACVQLTEGSNGFLVDCALPNDGEVVALVDKALDCPTDTRYVQVGTEFFCIPVPPGG